MDYRNETDGVHMRSNGQSRTLHIELLVQVFLDLSTVNETVCAMPPCIAAHDRELSSVEV